MAKKRHAAIIGAGISGLLAVKSFREEGFDVTCFEKTEYVGGLWRYNDEDTEGIASIMKTTIINSSKEISAISDFPPPVDYPNYMHNSMMYAYILSVAEKFDCMRDIKLCHDVLKVEKADDYEDTGRWKLTCKNTQTDEVIIDVFDCVVICNGHHVFPSVPTFPQQEQFEGKIIHSHSFKTAKDFEDMKIVVVGVGNSGVDAAVELSSVAKQVYLSSRSGAWIFPRIGPSGLPFDATFLRRHLHFMEKCVPINLLNKFGEIFMNSYIFRFDHELYHLKPKHGIFSQHPTMCDALPSKLLSGTVVIRGNLKEFTRRGVIFEGEENETIADAVILGTGYEVKFPFLGDDILPVKDNRVKLYKFICPPELPHPTLAVIGLIQPYAAGLPVIEMQCRWSSRFMNGKLALPSKEKMYADIKKNEDFRRNRYVDTPRYALEIDWMDYQDELAEEIGVKPNLLQLAVTDPKLFWSVCFGPSLPYQYRLQGPQAWEGARDAILTYDDRVKAPFRPPGQRDNMKKQNGSINCSLVMKTLLLLLLIWYLFSTVITHTAQKEDAS